MAGDLLTGVLVDSDVLIWTLRGNSKALAHLQSLPDWHISAVSYMELAQGCRNKPELARLKKGLAVHRTEIVPITPAISERAGALIDELALSHGLRLADALIGATAIEQGVTLLTANLKHFSAIEGLVVDAFIP